MTKKITKVIAALGVVAGLGVAALPLGSYAAVESVEEVTVRVTIDSTIGTIAPGCDGLVADSGSAGEIIDGSCSMGGSSNTGIAISIRDDDTQTSLIHTVDESTPIPAIPATAGLTNDTFAFDNIANINGGQGGWGYKLVAGDTDGLVVETGYDNWNGITSSDVLLATSDAATVMNGTSIDFRTVTPLTQLPGTYEDIVIITVSTNP